MLLLDHISLSIAGKPLLEDVSLSVPTGHKVGIVGRNGIGKSTFMKMIAGELTPDQGSLTLPKNARIGMLAQETEAGQDTVIDRALRFDTERTDLLARADQEQDAEKLSEIHMRLDAIEAHSAEARAARILKGLGFDQMDQHRAVSEYSGGWRMRISLAGLLFSEPDVLLLDEPTNYLDLEGTIWLENYLRSYPHTIFLISHDRSILNSSVTSILHMSDQKLTLYQGNYDQFNRTRIERAVHAQKAAEKQSAKRAHLQSFVDRFRYKASKAKQAQSKLKILEKMEPVVLSSSEQPASFNFPTPEELAPPIVKLEDVAVGYEDKTILSQLNLRIDQDDRIGLLGQNGQGKSTLLKLISGVLPPQRGSFKAHSKLRIGYFAQHQLDALVGQDTPRQHLQHARPNMPEKEHRSILARSGLYEEQADTKVAFLSGGQKAKLSLCLAVLDAPHLLILDEPTNHLDLESREALALALLNYEGAVMIVSHDPYLLSAIVDRLWLVKDGGVSVYENDLTHYRNSLLGDTPRPSKTVKKQKPVKLSKSEQSALLAPLRKEITQCEARIEKLGAMNTKLMEQLGDKELYQQNSTERYDFLRRKHYELKNAMKKAESLWINAVDALEAKEEEFRTTHE